VTKNKEKQKGDDMNLYYELLKKPVFTVEDVSQYYKNLSSAQTAVKRLVKRNLAVKIRNNLYTCISGETDEPVANRFQIACAIKKAAYLSHHTAMEYYGVANQVFYDVYVSSEQSFLPFEFNGYYYRCLLSKSTKEIEEVRYSGGIRITSKERTVIDSIKSIDKIAGIEEVISNIEGMTRLKEDNLINSLSCYQNRFLYQKVGFLLKQYQRKFALSDEFFELCKNEIGYSNRYLIKECIDGKYDKEWNLVIPRNIYQLKNGGFKHD